MTLEKPEHAMTFGELLALIGEQQHRIDALELTLASLAFALDERAAQLLLHNLTLESHNEHRDEAVKKHLALFAATFEKNAGLSS